MIVSDRLVRISNFLSIRENQSLVEYARSRHQDFVPTTTATNAANYRESLVLHSFPEFSDFFTGKVRELLPTICNQLLILPFQSSQIECQITSHNDGHFYKVHNDNGSAEAATRVLTYVYYFYREPRAFLGGQLRMYNGGAFEDIEPQNNSIVFFLSSRPHEVLPISCPSRQFADSRFTVNGWVRR